MKDIPRLLPIWVGLLLLVMALQQCGCRGGTSLGKGSAGTVILPQTPQEINESQRIRELPRLPTPPLEPLPPVPISSPVTAPADSTKEAARSKPIIPHLESAKANNVFSEVKPVGELKQSFSPTINKNAPPVSLPQTRVKLPPRKVINSDSKSTDTSLAMNVNPMEGSSGQQSSGNGGESSNKVTFNWGKTITWWMVLVAIVIFIWIGHDIIKSVLAEKEKQNKKPIKKTAVKKKSVKKAAAKKAPSKKKAPKKTTAKKNAINKKK